MKLPQVGTRVRYRGREGFVSALDLAGWVEVTLDDGKGPASTHRIFEDALSEIEILDA